MLPVLSSYTIWNFLVLLKETHWIGATVNLSRATESNASFKAWLWRLFFSIYVLHSSQLYPVPIDRWILAPKHEHQMLETSQSCLTPLSTLFSFVRLTLLLMTATAISKIGKTRFRLQQETVDEKSTSWRPFVVEEILSWSFFLFLDLQSKLVTQLPQWRGGKGGGRVKGTWVNICWVCAAGLSEPLPHFSKIQLLVYHQYCVLIWWATSGLYVIAHW